MDYHVLLDFLHFNRQKTLAFIDTVAKQPDVSQMLGWRPGPDRAHLAWQLMHIGATDDRHVHVRMTGGKPQFPDLVERFAGGSKPDEQIPSLEEIRTYLAQQRRELLNHLEKLDDSHLDQKPNPEAPWTYREWIKVLAWHEAHHQGQAHLTLNLYRASHPI